MGGTRNNHLYCARLCSPSIGGLRGVDLRHSLGGHLGLPTVPSSAFSVATCYSTCGAVTVLHSPPASPPVVAFSRFGHPFPISVADHVHPQTPAWLARS